MHWVDVCVWFGVCVQAKISLHRPTAWSQAISQSIDFSQLSASRETRTILSYFFIFSNCSFFCQFIKSPSKSTCVVPAWTLTSENASFWVFASRWTHQRTSDHKRCLSFWNACKWSLACVDLSESSFGAIQGGRGREKRARMSWQACGCSCTRASC